MVPQQLTALTVFREFMGNWSLGVEVGVGVVSCAVRIMVLQSVHRFLPHTFFGMAAAIRLLKCDN